MTIRTKASVKALFETGDRPTEQDFTDLIDSSVFQTTATSFAGEFAVQVSGASTARSIGARFHGKSSVFNVLDYGGFTDEGVQAAVSAAHEIGGGIVYLSPGTYVFDNDNPQVNLTGMHNVKVQGAGAATIISMENSGNPFFTDEQTDVKTVLDVDASAFDRQIFLPGSAAHNDFPRGSYIALESTEKVFGVVSGATNTTAQGQAMEIHQVVSQSASSITIDGPLRFDYTVAASSQFFRPQMTSGVSIMDMQFVSTDPTGKSKQQTMRLRRLSHFAVQNVRTTNMGGNVGFIECQDGVINNLTIDKQANFDNPFGYGLLLNGACSNIIVNNMFARDTRHAATTLSNQRTTANGDTFHGGPRNIVFNNCIGLHGEHSALAVWDTHAFGTQITYNNCIAEIAATAEAWQVRALDVTLNGCIARGGNEGVLVRPGADDSQISNCLITETEGQGVVLNAKRAKLMNSTIKGTRDEAIVVGTSGADCFISGNYLSDYNRSANGDGPIRLQFNSKRTVITNNVIPFISSARSLRAVDSGPNRNETISFNIFTGAWPDNTPWAAASGATRMANVIGSAGNNPGGGPQAIELTRQVTAAATSTGVSVPASALGFYVTLVSGRDVAIPFFRMPD